MIAYIIIHLICSFLSYGIFLAYATKEWPDSPANKAIENICFSLGISLLFGPGALFASLVACGGGFVHGFMIWPPKSTTTKDTQ